MSGAVYTIGHSTHTAEAFVALLARHEVATVADVRSRPYSRFNPQFNREPLVSVLRAAGIAYVFLGEELGARSQDAACYVGGRVRYERLAASAPFRKGLGIVEERTATERVALMCAEKDPLACHRTILVARELSLRGVPVRHILADGTLEEHEAATARLLAELGLPEVDLFRSHEEIVADAYRQRGEEIAYAEEEPADDGERSWAQR